MTALELLSVLNSKDIEIWADGDRLRYNAPEGALTPDLRKELTARKSEILALLRQTDTVTSSASFPLKPVSRAGDLPLSFAQERLWFLYHLEPDSVAYSMLRRIRLKGVLNKDALEKAYVELARRHETLRTTFHSTDGNPVLRIAAEPDILFDTVDLRHLPDVERAAEARRLCDEDARKPFDLRLGPLFWVRLFQLEDEAHLLHFNMHHIISDAWSLGVMAREIAVLYTAFSRGKSADLPELPVQYADYAVWQRQWLQGEALEAQSTYWKDKLGGELPVLELPTDRPRPAIQTHRGAMELLALPKELTEGLQAMSRREGVTLFMTLLAAFKTLLYRHTGQEDIVVGTPIAGRNRIELEGLIGYFMNTIVMRTDLTGHPTVRELLGRVRKTALGAYAHQAMPFEKLVDELAPERDLSRNPLFQVFFNHIVTMGDKAADLPGLEAEAVGGLEDPESKFDMTLNVLEGEGGIELRSIYNTDLFDSWRMAQMLKQYQALLESIASDPYQNIGELPLMREKEREEVIKIGYGPKCEYPEDQCFQEAFARQVTRNSQAVAVVFEDQSLTYRELNTRSNQLAHYLQRHGVGPEVRVGLCLNRSIEMIVAVLGIFKAGGAYVPMDPNYPQERLAFMAKDADLRVIVTQEEFQKRMSRLGGKHIHLDADWTVIGQEKESNPVSQGCADSLAYVIFTSGSTGRPKGVEVEHRQVLNYVDGILEQLKLPAGSSFAMVSTLTADLGNTMLYPALATGGTLHIISEDRATDSVALGAYFQHHQPDSLKIVPSHLASLMMGPTPAEILPQKRLVLGGEACPWHLVEKVQALKPGCRVINHYGPTETTVGVTTQQVEATDRTTHHSPSVPIGRPLANSQIYILDSHKNPVPLGVAGELYIGGRGLARGYAGAPELTAKKFVPHPHSEEPGARLYKTGDRAKFRPDGTIEFLGRIDHQVKLRGFRIELEEIETVLNQHKMVQSAVVAVREKEGRQEQLVAYVVPSQRQLSPSDLRQSLKQTLPEYMVPRIFVMLEDLPLTPNGKVDRRALPAPAETRPELEVVFQAPHAGPEQTLANIWKQLLGVDQVGRHDNFFELGGDSILSIQMGARANQAGLRVTPKQIFQHQTIAELAKVAGIYKEVIAEQGLVTGPLPLTPIQHWFFEQRFGEPHHWNMAWVLEAPVPLVPEHMEHVVETLLLHHDALRLRLTQTDEGWQQKLEAPDGRSPFAYFDWSHLSAAEAEKAWDLETGRLQESLSLSDGPLIRVALIHLGSGRPDRVLLVVHHLAVDGVSWRILLEDLQTAYDQLQQGKPIQLPLKTTSFRHWAESLIDYTHSKALKQELSYWQAVVNTPCAPLPRDFADGDNTVASTQTVVVALTREETQTLVQKIPEVYHTQINDVVLTALVDALAQWTNQENLLIYLEGHGREELIEGIDLSRTVGWFTSKFPVVLKGGPSEHPGECLKAVKEQLRQIPNRGMGFGVLRYLNRDINLQARFGDWVHPEVTFNYLGQFDQTLQDSTLFTWGTVSPGPTRSPKGNRSNLVEIVGMINAGMLQIRWNYSENIHRRATMEALANNYLAALRALILHCQSPEAGGYTPSDFPLAKITQDALDEILVSLPTEGNLPELADLYPLTPLQQGIWFHELAARESGIYFRRIVSRLDGEMDIDLLKRAWEEVVARHGILRTSFVWEGLDQPLQIVHPTVVLPWEQQDWRGRPTKEEPERLKNFLEEDRARGFDFTQPPLMRLTLIQVADSKALLVWTYHHLILDRWSIEVVQKEVWAAYQALRKGRALPDEQPRPFREYMEWLPKQDLAEAERYWRGTLKGFTAPTLLGVERKSVLGEHQPGYYDVQHLTLSEPATAALERFARQYQVTLNTLVQGAWAVLLSRYCGTEEVVFGITSSGRSAELKGMETMVGIFINTLPVRVQVDKNQLVAMWLKEMQTHQVGMRQYEYTPLFEIQKWSEVSPGMPLFNTLLVFENTPGGKISTIGPEGLSVQKVSVTSNLTTNYPLNLVCLADRALHMLISYDTEHFEAAAISQLLSHVQQVLAEMVAKPEQTLGSISLITEAERYQLLVKWNATETTYPRDRCVHQLFEQQVEQSPDAVAVVYGDEQLTFRQLNTRANQLAHYLKSLGVGPEGLVGICLERCLEMVIAVLGILKAGGAYVPLDPEYPQERLAFMLADTQTPVLITQQKLLSGLPGTAARLVCLDSHWEAIGQESHENPISGAVAENLAYVMYTSGSTGRPKGVCVTHRNVVRLVKATNYARLGAEEVFLQLAPISFDASTLELWGPLLNGGRLVVFPAAMPSLAQLGDVIEQHQVTILWLTAGLFHQMVEDHLGSLGSVRQLLAGGDVLSVSHVKRVLEQLDGCCLINGYGPTENTTFTTCYPMTDVSALGSSVPIGRPIANTRVYILDAQLQPVPIGVVGELYTGGDGLGRGYLNRPELTAEKFIPDPFSEDPAARLYKTGDLARYLSDGSIEFLGRIDHQVKIRGFRIELGEIEGALGGHPAVGEAVVIAREDVPGDKRLVAYVVARHEPAPTFSELRSFLKEKLPDYMIPTAFVFLDLLPLTPNGKVDRRALPAPEQSRSELENRFVAPRTSIEEAVAVIWCEVLGLEKVGMRDNFFDLGGHSLLMTRIHSKLQEIVEEDVSMITLFQFPTIGSLSNYLSGTGIDQSSFERIYKRAERQEKAMAMQKRMKAARRRING